MSTLEIFLFGLPRVLLDGRLLETERRKALALLAYLAIERQTHPREKLATLLWPDFDRSSALAYLRRTLWELSSLLGKEWLETNRQTVRLAVDRRIWLDTEQFQQLLEEYRAQQSSSDAKRPILEEAVQLYRADFLSGFAIEDSAEFEEWQRLAAAAVQREFRWALSELVSSHESAGEVEAALATARRWLALDDLNEEAYRAMIHLYGALGDRTSAVRQYESLVQKLREELAVTPQQATVDLYEAVLSGQPAVSAPFLAQDHKVRVAKSAASQARSKLPQFPTPFIGRRPEVEQIIALLARDHVQLLTLLGPGGSGKSRLAAQAAAELANHYHDGVWFVPLAPLQDSASIVPAVAKTLGFSFYREEERPRQQLLNYLREQRLLLILDNFEHIQNNESSDLVQEFLSQAPHLQIVVTSRSRLNVSGEQLFRVVGMKFPDITKIQPGQNLPQEIRAYSGLMLFRDRAKRVKPDFHISPDNLSDVVNICRLVEGMPLGIELAAAWLELLPTDEIMSEIKRSLDFLETDVHDVPDRQRSIRAVFDSSWSLLTDSERDVVMRLSIFPSTISRTAAQEVGRASLRTLLSLVNKSWLQPLENGRYQIHELLRQFALERLQKDRSLYQAALKEQGQYYTNLLHSLLARLRGSGQNEALEQITVEFDNIRAAWEWLLQIGDLDQLVESYITALYHFADMRMAGGEILPLLDRALGKISEQNLKSPAKRRAWTIFSICKIHCLALELQFNSATLICQEIFALLPDVIDPDLLGQWYYVFLHHYGWGVDLEVSRARIEERLPLLRRSNDRWLLANVLLVYARMLTHTDQYHKTIEIYNEALSLMEHEGDIFGQAQIYNALGSAEWSLGWKKSEPSMAIPHLQKAHELFEMIGVKGFQEGQYYRELGELSITIGEIDRAFEYYEREIEIHRRRGNRRLVINSLHWASMQAVRYQDIEYALKLRTECQEALQGYDDAYQLAFCTWEMGELLRVAGNIDQAKNWYLKARSQFEAQGNMVGIGYYHRGLGDIALDLGDYQEAYQRFEAFYGLINKYRDEWHIAYAQNGLGRALLGLGEAETAEKNFHDSLTTAYEVVSVPDLCLLPICGIADLKTHSGEYRQALALSSFVITNPLSWKEITKRAAGISARAASKLSPAEIQLVQQNALSWELTEVAESLVKTGSLSI